MRAVVLSQFGPPHELAVADVDDCVPGPDQVVLDVAFANITFVETQIRAGRPPSPAMLPQLPTIPGNGVGGVVRSVGTGVDPTMLGTRVITSTGGSGAYAQQVSVPVAGLIEVPDDLDLDVAVALLADGRTALALVEAAAPAPGQTVLVEAAAGGVGSLLVQLVKRAGARVVGAAGGSRKLELARALGADFVVDYRRPDWPERVRDECGSVDIVFDGVGGQIGRDAFSLLAASGTFTAFGMASGAFADVPDTERPSVTRVGLGALTPERTMQLARAALDTAARGELQVLIGQRFDLDRAADAHAAIEERRTIGKTLLVVDAALGRRHST